MSIATHAGARRSPHVRRARAAASRLDRVLSPLADLGGAIRDEIAVSLAPMAQELETALERMSTLELRVRDLEARLATAAVALLGSPIPAAQPVVEEPVSAVERTDAIAARPVVGGEVASGAPNRPESAAIAERQGSSAAASATAGSCSGLDTPSVSSAATGAAVEVRMRKKRLCRSPITKDTTAEPVPATPATTVPVAGLADAEAPTTAVPPLTEAVAASGACAAAATAPPAPVLNTPEPSVSKPSRPTPTAGEIAEQAPAAIERLEPLSDPSGASRSAATPGGVMHEGVRSCAQAAVARDPAAGILHPLLEQGAREMIAFGHYPDLTALLNEAVYRLLESDYPAEPGGYPAFLGGR
jgi:hypothetical protein